VRTSPDPPSLSLLQHKALLQSLALIPASSQHTVGTELTQSHRSNYLHYLHLTQHHPTPTLHRLYFYLYITKCA
jgi:hypothetical protein